MLRLFRYLAIPFHSASLLLVAIFSVLLTFAASGGILGLLLAAILSSWFLKYAFALLDRVAEGELEAPVLSYEMIHPLTEQRPLATAALLYVIYLTTRWLEGAFGAALADVVLIVVLLCLPAIVAVQGISGRFYDALDPRKWLMLVVRLREGYALILIAVGGFYLMSRGATALSLSTELPFALAIPLPLFARIAVVLIGWLALHTLIGGVLFEYRARIGFEPSRSPERLAAKAQRESDRSLDLVIDGIFAEWRGGAHGNAWRTVQAHLQRSEDRSAELRALFDRISRWPDPRLGNLLARELLPELLATHQTGAALDVVRSRLILDASFRPATGSDAIRMAELARDAGDRATARELMSGFESHFSDPEDQARAGRLALELAR
jgi:hypothetical protein